MCLHVTSLFSIISSLGNCAGHNLLITVFYRWMRPGPLCAILFLSAGVSAPWINSNKELMGIYWLMTTDITAIDKWWNDELATCLDCQPAFTLWRRGYSWPHLAWAEEEVAFENGCMDGWLGWVGGWMPECSTILQLQIRTKCRETISPILINEVIKLITSVHAAPGSRSPSYLMTIWP